MADGTPLDPWRFRRATSKSRQLPDMPWRLLPCPGTGSVAPSVQGARLMRRCCGTAAPTHVPV